MNGTNPFGPPSGVGSQPPPYGSTPPLGAPYGPTATPPWAGTPPGAAVRTGGPPTDGQAIAAFVCSMVGIVLCMCGVPSLVGLVLGIRSLRRIDRSGGSLGGRGLALAAAIIGAIALVIGIGFVLLVVLSPSTTTTTTTFSPR